MMEFCELEKQKISIFDISDSGRFQFSEQLDCIDDVKYKIISQKLEESGALLIRGNDLKGSKKLERLLSGIFDDSLLDYTYRSTPRKKMRGKIYTSTEYHPEEEILLHNENAYSNRWPMHIAFFCAKPSTVGGATPIADSRLVYKNMPDEVRDLFSRKGLSYVRNYGEIDLPWQEVFQTTNRAEVESYCKNNSIDFEWRGQNRLRTKQTNPAIRKHPKTGEHVWFNQAHMFHISSLTIESRESMLKVFDKSELPRNVYFGDGSPIEDSIFSTINQVLKSSQIIFNWQEGDLLLLDNMLFAHGRQSFEGDRRILTGMAGEMSNNILNIGSNYDR